MNEITLYTRDAKGSIREWAICVQDWTIVIRHGQQGGSMQYATEQVEEGKQNRSLDEQILSRVDSRISKQLDKGYVRDIKQLGDVVTNRLGLAKPMLAHKISDVKSIGFEDAYVQRKYDGNRCLIACTPEGNIAYSRNGKRMEGLDHIVNDIDLQLGEIIDGELYCHGFPLQTIVSWIKRKQPATANIRYHVYDYIANAPFRERFEQLRGISRGPNIELVETYSVEDMHEVTTHFRRFRDEGYEGAMLRWGNHKYEDGKRSQSLLKIKEWQDAEFKVVNVSESKDGWGILHCIMSNGHIFRVSAPGSMPEKLHVAHNPNAYIGQMVTVEYAYKTKDGVPFHPIAKCWR